MFVVNSIFTNWKKIRLIFSNSFKKSSDFKEIFYFKEKYSEIKTFQNKKKTISKKNFLIKIKDSKNWTTRVHRWPQTILNRLGI